MTRTYLELRARDQFRSGGGSPDGVRLERVVNCPVSFYRFLYAAVGGPYHWIDRLVWNHDQVRSHLARNDVSVWVLYEGGAPAGYFELVTGAEGSTEIAYFGLLQEFHGRGLGKHLLTLAVETAWSGGAARVWLHTCTLDGPAALPNYLRRGFVKFKEEKYTADLPAR